MLHKLKHFFVERCLPRGSPDGFTLIELLMIIFIVGLSAMIGLPTLNSSLKGNLLTGAAVKIVVALEYAQTIAMTTGAQTRVTIDASSDMIHVERFKISGDLMGVETELAEGIVESGAFAP